MLTHLFKYFHTVLRMEIFLCEVLPVLVHWHVIVFDSDQYLMNWILTYLA
jgi:hypothetical protein